MSMTFSWKRAWIALGVVTAMLLGAYASLFLVRPATRAQELGVQFSVSHAQWLGIDSRAAYTALLDEIDVRRLRLGAYWPEIERDRGTYRFEDLDWLMDEAAARGATVLLAVGFRLPRWPECHAPDWARALPPAARQDALRALIGATVARYRAHPALAMWQVENEPFLSVFGECPATDSVFFREERDLVRALDPTHSILITDSGELSTWMRTAAAGDVLGTTMYRVVWNRFIGYWSYDFLIPPAFYRVKAWLVGKPASQVLIAELQAEPWIPNGALAQTPLVQQRRSMDTARFRRHVAFARATGFRAAYLWGAEYWYWLKEAHGDRSLWDAAREVFRSHPGT